uniref:O-acyltransferase n=1 Tax=Naja naja TaxID=35670 RepID=A0A8C6XU35_NAJNA
MKAKVLDQVHNQLSDLLDKTLEEAAHSRPQQLSVVPMKIFGSQILSNDLQLPISPNIYYLLAGNLSLFYSTLLEVEHFCTIHHIFVAILCIFILKQIIVDSIDEGRLVLDFEICITGFRQLHTAALFAWLCMFLYTLFVPYQALQIWSGCLKMTRFPNLLTVTLVVVVLLCHAAMLGFFPIYIVVNSNLGIASCVVVLFEQIRFLLKSYSFLRESMPPLLHARDQISPPEFSTYLYFLFCPTLIYRKSYPRDPYIRWSYVKFFLCVPQFLACIYFLNFILKYYVIPNFSNMHKQPFTIKIQLLSIFDSALPGICSLLMMSYGFLDCWPNMFAEILRFADRSFYKDWWNSTAFSAFFRSWNVTVHDCLYCYIYQDFLWLTGGRARAGAILIIFLLSAVSHEYILILSFGFFCPVLFVLFAGTGVFFNFVFNDKRKGPVWNIIIWICLFLGPANMFSFYSQEFFAHLHCPLKEKTFWGLVTPRSWYCHP